MIEVFPPRLKLNLPYKIEWTAFSGEETNLQDLQKNIQILFCFFRVGQRHFLAALLSLAIFIQMYSRIHAVGRTLGNGLCSHCPRKTNWHQPKQNVNKAIFVLSVVRYELSSSCKPIQTMFCFDLYNFSLFSFASLIDSFYDIWVWIKVRWAVAICFTMH